MNVKFFFVLLTMPFCVIFTSCGSWYYCTLNSRGSSPLEKSYFVTSPDSTLNATLEFKEYANILKEHLNDLGYIEATSQNAVLRIELDYGMGEAYLANSATSANTYSYTYTQTNIKSNTTANANVKTNAIQRTINTSGNGSSKINTKINQNSNTFGSTTYGTSYTYEIPLLVSIRAFENKSGNPIWEIIVRDTLDRETQLQSVMPWLLLSTKEYIGRSSNGEQTIRIDNKKEIKEKYRLIWPY